MSELGDLLRKLRGKKSLRAVSEETGLSHSYIADIEKGYRRGTKTPLNPSPDTLKRLAKAYDYSYNDLLKAAGYLEEDNKSSEWSKNPPELTEKDERDIQKELQRMIDDLSSGNGYSQYDGHTPDEMEEEDRELLKASLENTLRLAKRLAKQKFTPKKYRK